MSDLEEIKKDLLAECRDDHVGLWSVIRYVEDACPGAGPRRIREITLELLCNLLDSGRIEAGFPDTNGVDFHPWPFPADAVIEQIQRHWLPTGPRPNIGEIVWFTAPSRLAV